MKYIKTLLFAGLVMLLSGCYDDKGGNDYDSVLPDVSITLPETTYSGSLGDKISITPTVTTNIDAIDLQYIWEVCGERFNASGRSVFVPLVADSLQGKDLNYTCNSTRMWRSWIRTIPAACMSNKRVRAATSILHHLYHHH
jgi:hypothetical protein